MVQLELDRVLVQSTISAPRFAVGMLASEELARLDLAAEDLLDSVATGRTQLPLKPKTASIAVVGFGSGLGSGLGSAIWSDQLVRPHGTRSQ